jgi:hypothetical protein
MGSKVRAIRLSFSRCPRRLRLAKRSQQTATKGPRLRLNRLFNEKLDLIRSKIVSKNKKNEAHCPEVKSNVNQGKWTVPPEKTCLVCYLFMRSLCHLSIAPPKNAS